MNDNRVIEFIGRYFEGEATEADAAVLGEALSRDADLKRLFVDFAMQRCLAGKAATADAPSQVKPDQSEAKGRVLQAFRLPRLALAAALLLAACGVAVLALALRSNPRSAIPNPQSSMPVATLIESTGSVYIGDEPAVAGEDYPARTVTLNEGEAEFLLRSGTTVTLRGRSELTLHDRMSATLTRGSAEFDCPPSAKGYTVHLPRGGRVVDLGTRFVVEIGEGSTAVRVLQGRVALDRPGVKDAAVELTVGTLAHMNPDRTLTVLEPDHSVTALVKPVESFVEAPHPDPRDSGLAFTVAHKPLLVYAMGFEDVGGDGLAVDHEVALFRTDTGERIATVTVPAGSEAVLIDRWRYVALTEPLMLDPGVRYTLAGARNKADPVTDRYPAASFEVIAAVGDPAAVYNPAPTDDHVIADMPTAVGPLSNRWSPANLRFEPLESEAKSPTPTDPGRPISAPTVETPSQ